MLLKRLILSALFVFTMSISLFAQLEVKENSFKEVPGFININTEKMYDDNNKPYAVLKIKTDNISDKQRRELLFQGDAATFFEVEYKVGEVWVYISYYATYLKISHPDFSSTEFWFPYDMEPKKGYELTLVNKSLLPVIPLKEQYNYLIINTDRPESIIYIDNVYEGDGRISKSFKVGDTHTWRIDCDFYKSESGQITVEAGEPMTIDRKLQPDFGYINVTSSPEINAIVFIDGKKVGVTPYQSDRMKSGEHRVRVVKELYKTVEEKVMVLDGNTFNVNAKLTANFVNIKIKTDSESDVYVDNVYRGKGGWEGVVTTGLHVFEARKPQHTTSSVTKELVAGDVVSITVPDPEPICGVIDVNSNPIGASIFIDGKNYGTTPRVLNDVMIGSHELRLEMKGYSTFKTTIVAEENDIVRINETLQAGSHASKEKPDKEKTEKVKPVKEKPVKEPKAKSFGKCTFITLNGAISNYGDLSYGLTIGSYRRFGWFVSAMTNFKFDAFSSSYKCGNDFLVDGHYPAYTGKESCTALSAMAGFIFRVAKPVALRLGVGYGVRNNAYEMNDGKYVINSDISAAGADVSLGAQVTLGGFVLSADAVTTNFKIFEAKIGIGYGFVK